MRRPDPVIEWPAGGSRILRVITRGARVPLRPLLLPMEQAYKSVVAARNRAYDTRLFKAHKVAVPVISVGNIVAGGAGKTPVTRWLTKQLIARGRRPAILHGGYGADEPKLHHEWHPDVPVIAGKDRVRGARTAIEAGADVIVLDDGFQHRRLARDLDVVLVAAESTNRHMLPRGPGREPLRSLQRSSYVLITRKSAPGELAAVLETLVHQAAPGVTTGRAHLRLVGTVPYMPLVAVASVARPDLFLEQLQVSGGDVERLLAYPDHFEYRPADADYIRKAAEQRLLVTTAKDAVKLRPLLPEQSFHIVDQELVFEGGEARLLSAIDNVL